MPFHYLGVFVALGFMIYLGDCLLYPVIGRPREALSILERLGYALALGSGALTAWMVLLSLAGVPFSAAAILLILLPAVAVRLISTRLSARAEGTPAGRSSPLPPSIGDLLPAWISLPVLGGAVLVVFVGSLQEPIAEVDAIAHWAFHAKVFYLEKTALPEFLTGGGIERGVLHWPPLLPLTQTCAHLAMGTYDDFAVKLIFPFFYLGMLGVVFGCAKRFLSWRSGLAVVMLLGTLPAILIYFAGGSVASAYADVPLALFTAGVSCALVTWIRREHKDVRFLMLAGVLAAIGIWVKREGLAFSAVAVVAIWIFGLSDRRRPIPLWHMIGATAIVGGSLALQALYKIRFPGPFTGHEIDPAWLLSPAGASRALSNARYLALEAANPARSGILHVLLVALIVLRFRSLRCPAVLAMLFLIAGQLVATIAGMALSDFSPEALGVLTARRMLIHVAPPAALSVALLSRQAP
jgi:hypothetical protein